MAHAYKTCFGWESPVLERKEFFLVFSNRSMHVRIFVSGKARCWKEKRLFIVCAFWLMHVRDFGAGKGQNCRAGSPSGPARRRGDLCEPLAKAASGLFYLSK